MQRIDVPVTASAPAKNGLKLNSSHLCRLMREGSWIVLGQIATVLGSLVLVRVLTERLDPSQYGRLALGLTVAVLVNQVIMGGVSHGIARYYSIAAEKNELSDYMSASHRLLMYATVAVAAVGMALIGVILWLGYLRWAGLAAATLVFSVLSGYSAAISGIQTAARQRAIVAVVDGGGVWLKIVIVRCILFWAGSSGTAVVAGYAVSSLVITFAHFFFLRRIVPRHEKKKVNGIKWTRQIWSFSWPFSTWGIFTWGGQSSERWALALLASAHEVGLLSVLRQLGYTPIILLTGLSATFIGPILFQRSGDALNRVRNRNVHRLVWRITLACLLLTLAGFLFTLGLNGLIFRCLVAGKYNSPAPLLPFMVLAGGLFAAGQMLSLKLACEMRPASQIRVKIITSLFAIGLNFYCGAVAGLKGIIAALVIFGAVYLLWMIRLTYRPPEINPDRLDCAL